MKTILAIILIASLAIPWASTAAAQALQDDSTVSVSHPLLKAKKKKKKKTKKKRKPSSVSKKKKSKKKKHRG